MHLSFFSSLLVLAGFLFAGSIFIEGRQYFHSRVVFEVEIVQHFSRIEEYLVIFGSWRQFFSFSFSMVSPANYFHGHVPELRVEKLDYFLLVILVGRKGIVKLMPLFNLLFCYEFRYTFCMSYAVVARVSSWAAASRYITFEFTHLSHLVSRLNWLFRLGRDLVNEGLFDIISDILRIEDKRLVLTG